MEVTVTAPAPLPTSEHLMCSVTSTESDFPSVNVNVSFCCFAVWVGFCLVLIELPYCQTYDAPA